MVRPRSTVTKASAPRCLYCRLLSDRCICDTLARAKALLEGQVSTRVLLVTHAYEQTQVSHTGHLLPALLSGAEQRWWARRHLTPDLSQLCAPGVRAVLLFPDPGARCLVPGDAGEAAVLGEEGGVGAAPGGELLEADALQVPLTLVVPDGTWRQARRLAHRHPVLSALPRVTLPEGGPPRWTVRRSVRPGGLCTLEAVARALGLLHGDAVVSALEAVLVAHDRAIWGARGLGRGPASRDPGAGPERDERGERS